MNATLTLRFDLPDTGGGIVELRPGEPATIGRDEDNGVRIAHATVSRHHARLSWAADGTGVIEDLQSANGTTLNGTPLARAEALQDGDVLCFGEVTAVYQIAENDAARLPEIEPAVGAVFAGRYRLVTDLGETTEYGNFLAEDGAASARRISLKVFLPGVIARAGGFAKVAAGFPPVRAASEHHHLIRLLDFGRWRGVSHLASEWIDGYPLLDLLRRRGALAVPETVRLARQAAAATDHLRADGLPEPDLNPRAVLVVFEQPIDAAGWARVLDTPVERWPAFALKICPRLFAPPASAATPSAFVALLCELFGHPPSAPDDARPVRIACLGEPGNAVLAQGRTSGARAFGSDTAFLDALARAAGMAHPAANPPAP